MEAELEELKKNREYDRKKHKDREYELERELVKEKDRLKKEMETQINEARNKLIDLANTRLEAVYVLDFQFSPISDNKIHNDRE